MRATPRSPSAPAPAASASIEVLGECAGLLGVLDDDGYTRVSARAMSGTVGEHVRHTLDHFTAVLAALDTPGTVIDYDRREGNAPVEASREAAAVAIASLAGRLAAVDEPAGLMRVRVRMLLNQRRDTERGGEGPRPTELLSTLGRELAFAAHHAVHHHAMIRAIMEEFLFSAPAGFGVSPSGPHPGTRPGADGAGWTDGAGYAGRLRFTE